MKNEGNASPEWRHPAHSLKWNNQQIDQVCKKIAERSTLTLPEIIDIIVSKYDAGMISDSTFCSYLEFSLITLKNVIYHAAARNS